MLFDTAENADLMRILVISAAANGIFYLLLHQLRWRLQAVAFSISSLVFAGVSIGATVVLVLFAGLGVAGVLSGQLLGALAGALVSYLYARELYRWRFDIEKLRSMLKFSVPLVPSSITVFVMLYVDRIAIKELMTVADVGLFGTGYRLAAAVSLIMSAVQMSITPLIYARYRDPETPAALARIFRSFVAVALVAVVATAVYAREILALITTPAYYPASAVIPVLTPALLLSAMYVFAPGLGIAKRTGAQAAITTAGAVVGVGLNLALIPLWGIVGAATATLLSAGFVFGVHMVMSQRVYFVPHRWWPMALAAIAAAALCLVGSLLQLPALPGLVVKAMIVAAAVLLVVRLGLVDAREIAQIVRAIRLPGGGWPSRPAH
jgi:O-antigen/teichoic acid export membrane protein